LNNVLANKKQQEKQKATEQKELERQKRKEEKALEKQKLKAEKDKKKQKLREEKELEKQKVREEKKKKKKEEKALPKNTTKVTKKRGRKKSKNVTKSESKVSRNSTSHMSEESMNSFDEFTTNRSSELEISPDELGESEKRSRRNVFEPLNLHSVDQFAHQRLNRISSRNYHFLTSTDISFRQMDSFLAIINVCFRYINPLNYEQTWKSRTVLRPRQEDAQFRITESLALKSIYTLYVPNF